MGYFLVLVSHFPTLASFSQSTKLFSKQRLVPAANNHHGLCHIYPAMSTPPCLPYHTNSAMPALPSCPAILPCHVYPAMPTLPCQLCHAYPAMPALQYLPSVFITMMRKVTKYTDTLLKSSRCRCYSLIFMCGETTHFTIWLSF